MPFKSSAPQSIKIASAKDFIPSIAVLSIALAPSINPERLSIKSVRCWPIAGSPDIMPSARPPIMLPTKSPIA